MKSISAFSVSIASDADIFMLEMIDEATIAARAGPGNIAPPFANEPEFLVTPKGMKYLRFASWFDNTDDRRLISWFLPFAGKDKVNARYCLYIEPDVVTGMNPAPETYGVKLPMGLRHHDGDDLDHISWRLLHRPWDAARGVFPLDDYRYDAESGSGYGTNTYMGADLKPAQWYTIEQRIELNTAGQNDGKGFVWIDDVLTWSSSSIRWRDNPLTLIDQVHINVFHGGETQPLSKIHYRIAKIAVSSSHIGVPTELR